MPSAWLQLFRVPNLPTAAGDAVAGAALALAALGPRPGAVAAALAAGAAELLLYMAGLADNDLVGAATDSPDDRPIPAGRLTPRAVRAARLLCLAGGAVVGASARLPAAWWALSAALVALIALYNRAKDRFRVVGLFAMGACRGMALLCGAAAVAGGAGPGREALAVPLVLAFLAWTLYVAALTRIGEDEERASRPLGFWRLAIGPAALLLYVGVPAFGQPPGGVLRPLPGFVATWLCAVWVWAVWTLAVLPLGRPHGPAERRRAVGRTIGGIFWLQAGLIVLFPTPPFLAFAAACLAARLLVRRLVSSVSGS